MRGAARAAFAAFEVAYPSRAAAARKTMDGGAQRALVRGASMARRASVREQQAAARGAAAAAAGGGGGGGGGFGCFFALTCRGRSYVSRARS